MFGELKKQKPVKATTNGFSSSSRKPGILIADPTALILTLLKFELEPRGFNVWLAVDGDDALDLYRQNRREIDLVLLDVEMPDLDGPRTLAALQELEPGILACFMTGDADAHTETELLKSGAICVFTKPFEAAEVAHILQKLVEFADFPALQALISRKRSRTSIFTEIDRRYWSR